MLLEIIMQRLWLITTNDDINCIKVLSKEGL